VRDSIDELESTLRNARKELQQFGGWQKFGEAMDEIARSEEAIADLRSIITTHRG